MALFGSEKTKTPASALTSAAPQSSVEGLTCIIAKGTVIEGKIITTENMRVDGKIKGDVKCNKRLVMDDEGIIEGNIHAGESTIKGKVVGSVTVENTLQLLESSFIKGDIKAKKLQVEEGAKYDGQCSIG